MIDICSQDERTMKKQKTDEGGRREKKEEKDKKEKKEKKEILEAHTDPSELRMLKSIPIEWMKQSSHLGPTTFDLTVPHENVSKFVIATFK